MPYWPLTGPTHLHPGKYRIWEPWRRVDELTQPVRWQPGTRYGIVRKDFDTGWGVAWFAAEEISREGRRPVFGGGSLVFDLVNRPTEPFPLEQAKNLGLIE